MRFLLPALAREVTAPDNLQHPIIQIHHNNMTISPLGTFEMMIYSEEMHNAIKLGYSFEIIRGYFFEKQEVIFKKYVTEFYNMRLQYDKAHPLNFIAKILLNSLYGSALARGMDDNFSESAIMTNDKFNEYINKLENNDIKLIDEMYNVGDNHMLVSKFFDNTSTMLNSLNQNHNVNIGIASAITALARVHMSKFKNNNIKLYYTRASAPIVFS
jgi:hypothetical protein